MKMASVKSASTDAKKPRKRFVGRSTAGPSKGGTSGGIVNQIPTEILEDVELNAAISQLPSNYSFEIHKTIHHIRKNGAKMVALQMPEGLQMFACTIADIIEQFTSALTVIMGDVTYGACCIDDFTAVALGCDMLVHYGHSCLVPIDTTTIKTLYIFVEISIDSRHLAETVRLNFPDDRTIFEGRLLSSESARSQLPSGTTLGNGRHLRITGSDQEHTPIEGSEPKANSRLPTRLALVSTIQFAAALQRLKEDISVDVRSNRTGESAVQDVASASEFWTGSYETMIPRSKPLSPGELLGCTAPALQDVDALLYLGDGRFHLESIMIANPSVPAFRYDPYSKKLTRERYNHEEMKMVRNEAVKKARLSIEAVPETSDGSKDIASVSVSNQPWGVILGTLGRQGSFKQLQAITRQLQQARIPIPYVPVLLSELSPAKLSLFNGHLSTFVQTSCPRLSIDWGYAFDRPLLSPYEATVAVGKLPGWKIKGSPESDKPEKSETYPMDFYAAGSPWAISRRQATFD